MKPILPQDDISDHQRDQNRLRRLEQADTIPTGAVVLWKSGTAVPDGWLLCNGSTFNGDVYPRLFGLWGSTTLPSDPGLTGYVVIVLAR